MHPATPRRASRRCSTTRGRSRPAPHGRCKRWALPGSPNWRRGPFAQASPACSPARCSGRTARGSDVLTALFTAFTLLITIYFVLWSVMQPIMGPIAAVFIWRHQRRHTARARALVDRLASPPRVSIIVPAFNEELTVVETVRGLLALDYEAEEIVVINDGSTD